MRKIITLLSLMAALLVATPSFAQKAKGTFEAGNGTFLLNGKPFVVKAAEIHYPRIPKPYWEHRIKMCKALGMNTVCPSSSVTTKADRPFPIRHKRRGQDEQ